MAGNITQNNLALWLLHLKYLCTVLSNHFSVGTHILHGVSLHLITLKRTVPLLILLHITMLENNIMNQNLTAVSSMQSYKLPICSFHKVNEIN